LLHIALAHQGLTNQPRIGPSALHPIEIISAEQTRFTHQQLVRYMKKARAQDGSTGTNLLKLLENRLDNERFHSPWLQLECSRQHAKAQPRIEPSDCRCINEDLP
jgi:hypothetical protein